MTTRDPRRQETPKTTQPPGLDLPTHGAPDQSCEQASPPDTDPGWLHAARCARTLSWLSLGWMTVRRIAVGELDRGLGEVATALLQRLGHPAVLLGARVVDDQDLGLSHFMVVAA